MRYLFFCILTLCEIKSTAQNKEQGTTVINIYTNSTEIKQPADTTKFYLVEVAKANTTDFKKQFQNKIIRQISANWFIIKVNRFAIEINPFIQRYFTANNNWKFTPSLLNKLSVLPSNKNFIFLIEVNDSSSFVNFIYQYAAQASIVSTYNGKLFSIKTTLSFIMKTLANTDETISIGIKLNTPNEETILRDYDNSVNDINLFFAKYPSINGDGLTVSLKENLFDTSDIDFKGRYKPTTLNSIEASSHATTMATLIGGGGNSFYTSKGVAWGCKLSSSGFSVLLPDANSSYRQYSVSVQNHSYGVGVENFYGSDAGAYDQSMIENPFLLQIFSAGNSGNLADSVGQYKGLAGFANITGSFKEAKNILTVGSVDSFYHVSILSSKGPAYDGRIKPELVAYGNDGSSGASAITSGTALAVQSAYSKQHNDSLPANALVKAIIINSADDVFNAGPDFYSGYGNVNTYRAVKDMLSKNYFSGMLHQNEAKDFNIEIPYNARNLKITLVWDDVPAQTNAFTALVNDLDLQLEQTSDHTLWLPWVLNSSPNSDSLNQLPERKRDSLNVVEQITIGTPIADKYIIHVNGYNVSTASQSFYVVYNWDTANRFQFISPAENDHFASAGNSIFRWNTTYTAITGKLEYSINGSTWNLINANVDLSKKYYQWIAPDTVALALARITIGNEIYFSDTFNFSTQLYPHVGFNCIDSTLIYWDKVKGINQYKIYQLGSKYLEVASVTADTDIILHNNTSPYIAVTTVFDNNHTGENSYTFDYNTQGVACYISNFLADLNANNKAYLQLLLGTIFNVRSVQFQELKLNRWTAIATFESITNLNLSYEDNTLHNGINTYRAIVTLNSRTVLYSNIANVYYFAKGLFVIMPNPVIQGQNLIILSNNFEVNIFMIYDIEGRQVLQKKLTQQRENIPTIQLAKGIYIATIFNDKKELWREKLIIQ